MPCPPFAFALSETAIRYGAFERVDGSIEFREFYEVGLSSAAFGAGVLGPALQEEGALRAGLEELLSRLATPPSEASLVVPDSWLRVVFAETGELPRSTAEREEVVRWKLKRLVPFKVDELRLRTLEVEPLPDQKEPRRLLLAFGAEGLLGPLEAAFSAYGIRLGRISNVSLSLLEAAWGAEGRDGSVAVVSLDDHSYTVVYAAAGSPVLYRYKPLAKMMNPEALESAVRRELRLTRTFVEKHGIAPAGTPAFLFAGAGDEERWSTWLAEELGVTDIRAGRELVRAESQGAGLDTVRAAPLMGAANAMVA